MPSGRLWLDPYGARFLVNALSSIDDYDASTDHYSLVAVSKGGQRFRIVDGAIKDQSIPALPPPAHR